MFGLERRRRGSGDEFGGSALRAEWARTDTENKVAVGGGLLSMGPRAVPVWDDPRATYQKPQAPRAGLTLECEMTWSAFGANGNSWGFDTTNPVVVSLAPGFRVSSAGAISVATVGGAIVFVPLTVSLGVSYRFRVVLLGALGVMWLASTDGGASWKVLWVDATMPAVPLYAGYSNNSATYTSDFMRVRRLQAPSPVLSDAFAARTSPGRADTGQPWLNVPLKTSPSLAAGDMRIASGATEAWLYAPTGVADGIWEGDLNFGSAPSTQKQAFIMLRHRDASNYLRATFNRVSQIITIVRSVAGVITTLATLSSAGFADNTTYRMRVVAVGQNLSIFQDGAFKLSVAEAAFQYVALCSLYLNDNLAAPDMRWDNVRVWGIPRRPLLLDTFDRPDGVYAPFSPDVGGAYATSTDIGMPAGAVVSEVIASGRGSLSNNPALSAAAHLYGLVPLPVGAFLASALLRWDVLTGNQGAQGMMLRRQDDQNYLAIYLNAFNNGIVVRKRLAGAYLSISSGTFVLVANTDALLSVQFTGNTLEVYINGVRFLTTTYTDFQAPGSAGPFQFTFGLGPMHLDDLRIYALTSPVAYHDSFTRADSAVTLGSAETPGTAWVPIFGSTWGISSNQAYNVDTTLARAVGLPFAGADFDVQADITRQSGSVGLIARAASGGTDYLVASFDGVNLAVQERVASGGVATLDSVAYNWPVGVAHTVRLRVLSGVLLVYSDGALLRSVPFAGHASAAEIYAGLYNVASNTNRFDNFKLLEVA